MSTTTTSTHTPGTWYIESWRSNFTTQLLIRRTPPTGDPEPRSRMIASVPWREEGPAIEGTALERATAFNARALANARLIAAAPDLLMALQAVSDGFADGSIRWACPRQADSEPYHHANVLMCAAIAKAAGAP